jgi:hypothetical protein
MSKSIFAACEAPAPAFRQADLPRSVPFTLRGADFFGRWDRTNRYSHQPPLGKSRDVQLTLQKLRSVDNLHFLSFGGIDCECRGEDWLE